MSIRVAINGFGRIGRNVLRSAKQNGADGLDFVAVNDLTDAETLAHLLRYDSVHGAYPGTVEVAADGLVVDGDEIRVLSERDPAALPWKEMGVDVVIESTGIFRTRAAAAQHLEAGAKKVIILNVSGAFHSPLMEPAALGLSEHLDGIDFRDPTVPVISNVTARPVTLGPEARDLLVSQLTSPVLWSASIATMVEKGVDRFLELGPGKVLSGLNKRNAKGLPSISVGEPDDLEGLKEIEA